MEHLSAIVITAFGVYMLTMGMFLISENRRPQSTLAWLLVFYLAPGLGLLIYILFGRDRKAFIKRRRLLMQDLETRSRPLLEPLLSRQDAEIGRLEGESPVHRKLMVLVRRNSRSALTTGNRVEIQQDAAVFYPSLMEDMAAAKHSIHLQYFIWRADDFTRELKELLKAKVREGVQVRLLYDPVGSTSPLHLGYIRDARAGGIQMAPTSPFYHLHTISYRNHRKITVIDGRIGYTGGMNIGKEHLDGGKGFTSWRDTQVRIVGPGAVLLQAVFMTDWYNAVRENLFDPEYFPAFGPGAEPYPGDVPLQILTSGPDSQWAAIRQLYSTMIATAQRHVFIQSPYFILDSGIAEALRSAALSGVDVRVMLSSRASGNQLPEWAGNTFILEAIEAGVRVYLYEKGYLHAKTIAVASQVCSIGSANIDIRSFSINYELNAVLYSERLTRELEDAFHKDLEHCSPFTADEYRRRAAALRFRDSAARLLSPLL
jgi:cardiolipin synthase